MTPPTLGDRLRRIRAQRRLTIEAGALRIGCSKTQWSNWENDISRPGLDNFAKLLALLECEPGDLLGTDDPLVCERRRHPRTW